MVHCELSISISVGAKRNGNGYAIKLYIKPVHTDPSCYVSIEYGRQINTIQVHGRAAQHIRSGTYLMVYFIQVQMQNYTL